MKNKQILKKTFSILLAIFILFALAGTAAAAPHSFIVTFMFDDEDYYKKSVPRFTVMSEIETPVKEGYVFSGWYSDPDYSNLYDFSQSVNESFYLYAKWIPGDSAAAGISTSNSTSNTNSNNPASTDVNNSSNSKPVLPIPSETVRPASGKADIADPIASLPSPATLAFLILAGLAAAIIAYFMLIKVN